MHSTTVIQYRNKRSGFGDFEEEMMAKETIWLVGVSGRMGAELLRQLKKNSDYKIIDTDTDVDITDVDAVEQAMDIYRPNVVINCASMSDVEECEKDMVQAFKVNALGARNLAAASRRVNAKIIQISTDDVFDGIKSGTLTEFDNPCPKTVYGKSKLAGENYVKELNPKHLIIRSSWVYGGNGKDYFSYVAEHGKNNQEFEAPLDKISTPTSAKELAKFIVSLMDKSEYGIYHASCEGVCSRHEFAKTILAMMGYDITLAKGIFSENNKGQSSTLLENLMMKMTEVYTMPQWQDALKEFVDNYKND